MPDTIVAGQPFKVHLVANNFKPNESIYLLRHTSWGTTIDTLISTKILVDTLAGWVTAEVLYKGKSMKRKHYMVRPKQTSYPLDTYLGSKSIIANGQDWAMLTAVPTDTFGNLVQDQTPVQFEVIRPNQTQEYMTSTTQYGVAYQRINAKTKAGKTLGYIYINERKSREKELLEVADYPVKFEISTDNHTPFADARQTFKVKTSILKDRFGNIVPEGTAVIFYCQDANHTLRQFKSYTLGGIATIALQNPASAGLLSIEALVYGGSKSNILTLTFAPPK